MALNVKYGISGINWVNEDMPDLGDHYTADDVLSQMQALGFEGTEFCRKFPRSVPELSRLLERYGMTLVAQWKSLAFRDASRREEEMRAFREHADFLRAMGSRYVVACETGDAFEDPHSNRVAIQPLTDEQWRNLAEGLNEAGRYCQSVGLELVYHYHGETVIERGEDIRRLMESTDPAYVHMLYDTGHAYYGGSDPLDILRTYYDRIRYIHLKDVRRDVLERARRDGLRFREAVRQGVFTVPGDGCIDFAPIYRELHERGYEGWILIEAEQDPAVAEPTRYARQCMEYIRGITP